MRVCGSAASLAVVLSVLPGGVAQRTDPGGITITTTQQATSRAGYSTFRVAAGFDASVVADVYALFGEAGANIVIPPAWQAAAPFGSNVGPTNPAFFAVSPECEFDSFLTIGMDGPALIPGAMSSVGIDFGAWSETAGIDSDNGAVFFMDPDHGATAEPVVFLQLTVRAGSVFSGQFSAQGRTTHGGPDWLKYSMEFTQNTGSASAGPTPAPPPPPRPPPPPYPGADANDACISAKSCEELQAMFVGAFPFKRPPICAESDDGLGSGGTTVCTTDGFEQARAICFEAGARLCTIAEIMGGATGNTGCGFNSVLVWSASPCTSGENGIACTNGNPRTNPNHIDELGSRVEEETCTTDLATPLGIRCCADGEAGRAGKSVCDVFAAEESDCTSSMSCADLSARDGGGWPTARGDVLVCGETEITVAGDEPACFPGETWEQARSICTGAGARLCTVEELECARAQPPGRLDYRGRI